MRVETEDGLSPAGRREGKARELERHGRSSWRWAARTGALRRLCRGGRALGGYFYGRCAPAEDEEDEDGGNERKKTTMGTSWKELQGPSGRMRRRGRRRPTRWCS